MIGLVDSKRRDRQNIEVGLSLCVSLYVASSLIIGYNLNLLKPYRELLGSQPLPIFFYSLFRITLSVENADVRSRMLLVRFIWNMRRLLKVSSISPCMDFSLLLLSGLTYSYRCISDCLGLCLWGLGKIAHHAL